MKKADDEQTIRHLCSTQRRHECRFSEMSADQLSLYNFQIRVRQNQR